MFIAIRKHICNANRVILWGMRIIKSIPDRNNDATAIWPNMGEGVAELRVGVLVDTHTMHIHATRNKQVFVLDDMMARCSFNIFHFIFFVVHRSAYWNFEYIKPYENGVGWL